MSREYIIKIGDTLQKISRLHYGEGTKSNEILNANPGLSTGKLPVGLKIIIPDVLTKGTKDPVFEIDNISITIDGISLSSWQGLKIEKSIDSIDTFSFEAPFNPDINEQRILFEPFKFKRCVIKIENETVITGYVVSIKPNIESDQIKLNISGYSLPGILNDTSIKANENQSLEWTDATLTTIVRDITRRFGIQTSFLSSSNQKFESVAMTVSENALSFIIKLAKQRGILVSNDNLGRLLFWRSSSTPSGVNLEESKFPYFELSTVYNGQNYFNSITGALPEDELFGSSDFTWQNPFKSGVTKTKNIQLSEINEGSLRETTIAAAGRMFAETINYTISIPGLKKSNGDLWKANETLSLISPSAMIYNNTLFLIKKVTFSLSGEDKQTVLSLVLPESYNGSIPKKLPWS